MGTKTLKSTPDSKAGVVVSTNTVRTSVSEDNGILVDEKGVTINGPISIVSNTSQIRTAGLWTFNDVFQLMIPSTLATPRPTLMIDSPTGNLEKLMEESTVMIGLLLGISSLG